MKHELVASRRKSVNLSLDEDIVAQARAAGLNLSRVSEAALREATLAEKRRRWLAENQLALEGWGRWVEKNGLPLERYRLF